MAFCRLLRRALGDHIGGDVWCWIEFAIGLIFTSKKLAEPRAAPSRVDSAADLIGKLGKLMERYPTALIDSSRLSGAEAEDEDGYQGGVAA
jgi:hypothetical protein